MFQFIVWFTFFTLVLALFFGCTYFLFWKLESKNIFTSSGLFFTNGSLLFEFLTSIPSTFLINIGFCGLRLYYEHLKLQEVHLKAQLQILQQQINPHFMFNVLNHIHILMQKNTTMASDLLVKYSGILRYQLYSGKEELVNLDHEIQFLKDVIDVEKIRWGNELKVYASWEVENGKKQIQPLLLITFIENAFKHVSRSISENGYIRIDFKQKKNFLCMEVENSKSMLQIRQREASGLGLNNIQERLKILYPKKHKLSIEETDSVYIIRLNINL